MARLGSFRDTHLSRDEIAGATLRLFDAGPDEPSLRTVAAEVNVAPASIYHHFSSLGEIYQASVEKVWDEATANLLGLVPNPFEADPVEVLVASALATRRAWLAHFRLARYMAATPAANEFTDQALALMSHLFDKLGLRGEAGAEAMHSYSSFMLGAVLFAAMRVATNEGLERPAGGSGGGRYGHNDVRRAQTATRAAIDQVMDVSVVDPERDEKLFVRGLRRLIASILTASDF